MADLSEIISKLETTMSIVVAKQPPLVIDKTEKTKNDSFIFKPHPYKLSSSKASHWASVYKDRIKDKKFMEKFRVDITKPRQCTK